MDIDGFILMQPHLITTFLFFSAKQKKGRGERINLPGCSRHQYSPTGSQNSSGNASCTCIMNICVQDIGAHTYTIHMIRGDHCVHCTFKSCHPNVSGVRFGIIDGDQSANPHLLHM
jgi:hypothetical protein